MGFLYQVNYDDKAGSNDKKHHAMSQGQTKSEEGLELSISPCFLVAARRWCAT